MPNKPCTKLSERKTKIVMADRGIDTIEELSLLSDVHYTTIQRLFNGKDFHMSTADALAVALGCHPFDLLEPEGFQSPLLGTPASNFLRARFGT
jgi:hypothetical protein